jgi:IclR family transcriptional regulator, pca regulon regulatory protein
VRDRTNPDFVEALARGLDVLKAFGTERRGLSLSDLSTRARLPRPTVRRLLITLSELGYVRSSGSSFSLTPRVLELGMAYFSSQGFWEIAEPRLSELVAATGESCSIAQLDGSDIVYVARVAVPRLVTLSVTIGTRFPAVQTSLGKVLLASLSEPELDAALSAPSLSDVTPAWQPERAEIDRVLAGVRAQGWALSDQQLAAAIRSIAVPLTDADGHVFAAVNVNAHAAETSIETLTGIYLPHLQQTAADISGDRQLWMQIPRRDQAVTKNR